MSIDWMRMLESLTGTIVGGLIAISAIWIKEALDAKKAARAWYQQQYITDGIDVLISFAVRLEDQLDYDWPRLAGDRAPAEYLWTLISSFPIDASVRVNTVLQDGSISSMLRTFGTIPQMISNDQNEDHRREVFATCSAVVKAARRALYSIRRTLLTKNVRRPADIYSIGEDATIRTLVEIAQKEQDSLMDALNLKVATWQKTPDVAVSRPDQT